MLSFWIYERHSCFCQTSKIPQVPLHVLYHHEPLVPIAHAVFTSNVKRNINYIDAIHESINMTAFSFLIRKKESLPCRETHHALTTHKECKTVRQEKIRWVSCWVFSPMKNSHYSSWFHQSIVMNQKKKLTYLGGVIQGARHCSAHPKFRSSGLGFIFTFQSAFVHVCSAGFCRHLTQFNLPDGEYQS